MKAVDKAQLLKDVAAVKALPYDSLARELAEADLCDKYPLTEEQQERFETASYKATQDECLDEMVKILTE